jgi:DNA polymerase III subunit delta'
VDVNYHFTLYYVLLYGLIGIVRLLPIALGCPSAIIIIVKRMWDVFGQSKAVNLLDSSAVAGRLAHAYLFIGPEHIGKKTLALNLARALNCLGDDVPCGDCVPCARILAGANSDVQIISLADGAKEIGIDQIRDVQHTASLKAYESKYRVFIIDGAQHLSTEASNSLLKTLEEPPENVLLILTAVHKGQVMPTILSRCQTVQLHPVPIGVIAQALVDRWGVERERANMLAGFSGGAIGWALEAIEDASIIVERADILDKAIGVGSAGINERFNWAAEMATLFGQDKAAVFFSLGLWTGWWRDILLYKQNCLNLVINLDRLELIKKLASIYGVKQISEFVNSIQSAVYNLRRNVNPRLTLEVLMLSIPKMDDERRQRETRSVSF